MGGNTSKSSTDIVNSVMTQISLSNKGTCNNETEIGQEINISNIRAAANCPGGSEFNFTGSQSIDSDVNNICVIQNNNSSTLANDILNKIDKEISQEVDGVSLSTGNSSETNENIQTMIQNSTLLENISECINTNKVKNLIDINNVDNFCKVNVSPNQKIVLKITNDCKLTNSNDNTVLNTLTNDVAVKITQKTKGLNFLGALAGLFFALALLIWSFAYLASSFKWIIIIICLAGIIAGIVFAVQNKGAVDGNKDMKYAVHKQTPGNPVNVNLVHNKTAPLIVNDGFIKKPLLYTFPDESVASACEYMCMQNLSINEITNSIDYSQIENEIKRIKDNSGTTFEGCAIKIKDKDNMFVCLLNDGDDNKAFNGTIININPTEDSIKKLNIDEKYIYTFDSEPMGEKK